MQLYYHRLTQKHEANALGNHAVKLNVETGLIRLDRILFTSTNYPIKYGFVPRTLADDEDPLDVLALRP